MKNSLLVLLMFAMVHAHAGISLPECKHPVSCVFKTYSQGTEKPVNIEILKLQAEKADRRKIAGIIMMAVGGALLVTGEALQITSLVNDATGRTNYDNSTQDPVWVASLPCIISGVGLLAAGIPVYIVNRRLYHRITHRINNLSTGKTGIQILDSK